MLALKFCSRKTVKMLLNDTRVNMLKFSMELITELSKYGHYQVIIILLKNNRIDLSIKNNDIFNNMCRNSNNVKVIKI
jgi:hypothetical protein